MTGEMDFVTKSPKSGFKIINLDPVKTELEEKLNHNDSKVIVGKDCFLIKEADIVIVNLTDDISVGGSQEMLIAKYYKKHLIGLAPKGGKFNKIEKEVLGKIYRDWKDPFVSVTCDVVVENMDELADFIKKFFSKKTVKTKGISILEDALRCYKESSK